MGKRKPKALEKKGVLRQNLGSSPCSGLVIPPGPVYYPTEEEFKDPLKFIYKIRPEAEPYGICRIVPPSSWKPPFALDLNSFTFPTKSQAIHQLQARPASCDSKIFDLEYDRFLRDSCGKKVRKRVVFEAKELDLCKLFNAVKRFGGYDKAVKKKKWREVFHIIRPNGKVSECGKHVLSQLYREHLYDYEHYYNRLNKGKGKINKRKFQHECKSEKGEELCGSKKRRKNNIGNKVRPCDLEEDEVLDQICEQCKSGLHGDVMLLCDQCNKGWHIYCLSPPLKQVPPGNWYCFGCLNSNKDSFGFVPGKQLTLEAFRRVADRAKKKWFGPGPLTRKQVEKKFWQIVEGSVGEVEVMYGSDVDTSVYGSGFPRTFDQTPASSEASVWNEYCSSPWNLNNLPKLEGSMLRKVQHNIAGIMVPWLYVGMLFSAFCWHYEDHCFYSMNYLHWGEPKCWYSVPGSSYNAFEKVMRNTLPDLFDAQPDLLFQLVTMLNPSVLHENGVPVYNVIQEPGNFVITFPRSYHGGFNFGFNCAEAVNFAPADWIPHGGFSAELYRLYRKPAILSHEELLCVVAKSICDDQASTFLKKELLRIYNKEKIWRERLWKSGITRSSPLKPRGFPELVGSEEDPTCRICQQYLFLSGVVCRCRPSASVCLEHWDHICECKPRKHRLLYRHSLAELKNLVLMIDEDGNGEGNSRPALIQNSCPSEMNALSKKVKGEYATFAQLAEEWLSHCSKIIEEPFSKNVYSKALKKAEQFLWAGSEMDPVRNMQKRLSEAQNWAKCVRDCLERIADCSYDSKNGTGKVDLEMVEKLSIVDPAPCNEPVHLKLKNYAEEAQKLVHEINVAISSCCEITELETLWSRCCDFPIYIRETEKLSERIFSVKAWIDKVRLCALDRCPDAIEIEDLYKLQLQISELQVSLPEVENLVDLVTQAESCRTSCIELLRGSMALKDVEIVIQEMDKFPVVIPELQLLRQYYAETISLITRFKNIQDTVHESTDQDSVVDELRSILNEGASLKIQVDILPAIELELKKACCRGMAVKACSNKMSLYLLHEVMTEAIKLQIEMEKLFVLIAETIEAANVLEENAACILRNEATMFEFEEVMRTSKGINASLPSLGAVVDAITAASSWLRNSKPFLDYASSAMRFSGSLLKVGALKELVAESKLLKIYLEERKTLLTVLKKIEEWETGAGALLQDVENLLDMNDVGLLETEPLTCKIEGLINSVDAVARDGLTFGFDFPEIPTLLDAKLKLQWCHKVLSLSTGIPPFQEVDSLIKFAECIPVTRASGALCCAFIDVIEWVKRAVEVIQAPSAFRSYSLRDAEEVISDYPRICVSFPMMIEQLNNTIQSHMLWQEQVCLLFSKRTGECMLSELLQLKETAKTVAFACSELERLLLEVEKVETWKSHIRDKIDCLFGDDLCSIIEVIEKIKISLDRSLNTFDESKGHPIQNLCTRCFDNFMGSTSLACVACKDCYHPQCLQPACGNRKQVEVFMCRFCQFLNGNSVSLTEESLLDKEVKRVELTLLTELLSQAEDLYVWIDERGPLEKLLECARSFKARLDQMLDFVSAYMGEDLSFISGKLKAAFKAVEVARVVDKDINRRLRLALVSYSWRVRVRNFCEGSQKPSIQQIQLLLKEGMTISIPSEDNFRRRLVELVDSGHNWVNIAKEVVKDEGALGLGEVFTLIREGENLPVSVDKELKMLRSRSKLFCICRKPYRRKDGVVWITCDRCNELYHMDCIKLSLVPKFYICPACKPPIGEWGFPAVKSPHHESGPEEPMTPSPRHRLSKKTSNQAEFTAREKLSITARKQSRISFFHGIDQIRWANRKPYRRSVKKRTNLECLSLSSLAWDREQ